MPRFLLGSDPHAATRELIPWVVNGHASPEECTRVRTHLDACAACRADYEQEAQLYRVMHEEGSVVFAPENSFQKLMTRIDSGPGAAEREPPAARATAALPRGHSRTVRWLAAAVVVQALGLGFSAWLLNSQNRLFATRYFTQTQAAPDYTQTSRVRAVFAPDITLEALQRLLIASHARIIDGPTEAGVYTLGFAPGVLASRGQLEARVRELRADPRVRFAEPVAAGVPP